MGLSEQRAWVADQVQHNPSFTYVPETELTEENKLRTRHTTLTSLFHDRPCSVIGSIPKLFLIFLKVLTCTSDKRQKSVADLRGGARDARPLGSKFFHFHAVFSRKNRLAHPLWELAPPLGKILDPPLEMKNKFPRPEESISLGSSAPTRSLDC